MNTVHPRATPPAHDHIRAGAGGRRGARKTAGDIEPVTGRDGVDLPTVQRLMGHTDIQTTMIYAYVPPDHLADAVDKLAIKV